MSKRGRSGGAAVDHHRPRDRDRRDPDRHVDQQHPPPRGVLRDDAGQQHADRAAEAVHRRPQRNRPVAFGTLSEVGGDDPQRGRGHQRPAEALNPASDDQYVAGRSKAAEQRRRREDDQRRDERPPMAVHVADSPGEHQHAAEHDRVRVDDPVEVGGGEVQSDLNRRQRDVDDPQVEDDHELRDAADGEQGRLGLDPGGLGRGRCGRRGRGLDRAAHAEAARRPVAVGVWFMLSEDVMIGASGR